MIFGLFESKEAKFWRDETNRTLNDARQRFDASERKKISINVLKRILQTLKDIENLDQKTKKEIMFELIDEVDAHCFQNSDGVRTTCTRFAKNSFSIFCNL